MKARSADRLGIRVASIAGNARSHKVWYQPQHPGSTQNLWERAFPAMRP